MVVDWVEHCMMMELSEMVSGKTWKFWHVVHRYETSEWTRKIKGQLANL